jgi:hypothetical protein
MDKLGSKQPYEEYYVAFNFANVIGSATIATANVVVRDATDATCTVALTVVANQTLATNTVNIWIKGGLTDNEYKITCQIETDSTPAEKYELDAILPVAEL